MRASSISQNRGAGAPRKVTGAGTAEATSGENPSSASVPTLTSALTSKLLQSRRPPSYSSAVSVSSSSGFGESRAATETAYSSRDGFHVSAAPAPGSAKRVSHHVDHRNSV